MVSQSSKPRRRGLVLGCGGTLGAAWMLAALHELERALGWDARDAAVVIGTSSGAEIATLLATGASVRGLLDASLGLEAADVSLVRHFASPPAAFPPWPAARVTALPLVARGLAGLARSALGGASSVIEPLTTITSALPVGRGDGSRLAELVEPRVPAGAWAPHPALYLVAVDLASGERVAFGKTRGLGANARRPALADALRASWAIPGWYPPVVIEGRRFTDGGVASPTSADLLADEALDEVIIVAPMASRGAGPRRGLARLEDVLRRTMTRRVDLEARTLERAGVAVHRVEPTAEDLEVMGPNFMDGSRRLAVLESSLRTTRRSPALAVLERSARA